MTSENFKKVKKVPINVKVDPADLEAAKKKNLNISAICRYAIKQAIAGKLYKQDRA